MKLSIQKDEFSNMYIVTIDSYERECTLPAGYIRKGPKTSPEGEYWRFWPSVCTPVFNCSNLRKVAEFISDLNTGRIPHE